MLLKGLMEKYHLNCNKLSKQIKMSNAMVRLISLDQAGVSASTALRFAKFFGTSAESWLILQAQYDLAEASTDKALVREVAGISKAVISVKTAAPPKAAKKPAARGKKPAARGRKPKAKV
jgi:addiction module HigA family antidote